MDGDRDAGDRAKVGGRCTGPGEEEMGSGIPKLAGGGRNREKCAALCNIWQSKKREEAGANKYRAGTGIKRHGKWEV